MGWTSKVANLIAGLVCGSSFLNVADAKKVKGTVTLGQWTSNPKSEYLWKYLSKFAYYEGDGKYAIRVHAVRPHNAGTVTLPLEVYLDEEWDEVEATNECNRTKLARATRRVNLPADGSWSDWVNGTLVQRIRPHVWFFALTDCKSQLPGMTRIRYEIEMYQEDGSHFSVEHTGILTISCIKLILCCIFMHWFVKGCRRFWAASDNIHPVIITLAFAIVFQFLTYVFQFFHYWSYSHNGSGVKVFDVLSEISAVISQILVTSLTIFLALGYTITTSELGDLDIVVPIFFIICIIHVLVVGFAKIRDDASYKFHENEGVFGLVLIAMRLGMWAWFYVCIKQTYPNPSAKLKPFITKFTVFSSIYYLAYPILFLIVSLLPQYFRHKAMVMGLFAKNACTFVAFTVMFLTRGDYFAISTLGGSFLPSGSFNLYAKDH